MSKTCLMCGATFPDSTTFCPRDGAALRSTVIGDDLIGELLCERYVVTDLLGEGGMGAVYLARDVRLPQQVAIKVLRDSRNDDQTAVQRFRREAEAASRINHDRVARVTDFGFMADGRAYLIMEYVNGRTLAQLLDDRGALDVVAVASITSMVAEGLNAAHRLGIVHRDLKPENIMIVDEPDAGLRVKVLDFGIAKVLEGNDGPGSTAPGFVIGSPRWMSPEQLLGGTLDGRSDVYALALLAFTMLTGSRPFARPTEQEEMLARLSVLPRTLIEAAPEVAWPQALQTLFSRTLVRDPAERPATALAFARELTTALEAVPAADIVDSVPVPTLSTAPAAPGLSSARQASPTLAPQPRRVARLALWGGVLSVIAVGALFMFRAGTRGAKTATIVSSESSDASVPISAPPAAPVVAPSTAQNTADSSLARTSNLAARDSAAAPSGESPARRPPSRADGPPKPASTSAAVASASDELERLMQEAEAGIGSLDETTKRAKATTLIRELTALSPRLTTNTDRGWALFYIGTARATLGENENACTILQRAQALASSSSALRSSAERLLSDLNCLPR